MADHDETGGWVFSDDYHQWQDGRSLLLSSSYRHGDEGALDLSGWGVGFFTIKSDRKSDDWEASASWPSPHSLQDLNGHYHKSYFQTLRGVS
jgi:hypothetical protein